jgi:cobalt-zinc-cadmium efflux system protein
VIGALRLLRDAGLVLLEAAPAHLPVAKVEKTLLAVEGVRAIRALHVWSLGTGHDAIAAHVSGVPGDQKVCSRARAKLMKSFGVEYVTIQLDED